MMKTVHRIEVEIDNLTGVEFKKGNRQEVRPSSGAPGYGVYAVLPTIIVTVEGEREPVELLNDLRDFAHALLDSLERA